jgi:hypothetical protein
VFRRSIWWRAASGRALAGMSGSDCISRCTMSPRRMARWRASRAPGCFPRSGIVDEARWFDRRAAGRQGIRHGVQPARNRSRRRRRAAESGGTHRGIRKLAIASTRRRRRRLVPLYNALSVHRPRVRTNSPPAALFLPSTPHTTSRSIARVIAT